MAVPEIIELARTLPERTLVLDGEAIALREGGRPHPFQVTMSRFGTKAVVEDVQHTTPLSAFFFDCLHADGDACRAPGAAPGARQPSASSLVVPRIETEDEGAAQQF
jgi:DNA ligase-1